MGDVEDLGEYLCFVEGDRQPPSPLRTRKIGSNANRDADHTSSHASIDIPPPATRGHVSVVTCPYHGWTFRLDTGECISGRSGNWRSAPRQPVYPTRFTAEGELEIAFPSFDQTVFEDVDF